jgi:hypothetical protein
MFSNLAAEAQNAPAAFLFLRDLLQPAENLSRRKSSFRAQAAPNPL